jgi:glutamine amidotransferase
VSACVSATPRCVVVDYSKGNLRSVEKGLERAGASAFISASPKRIAEADAIVLPGVGSFADASAQMAASGQMQAIRERVRAGVPFLGICLGLQLLLERGDEGVEQVAYEHRWAEGLGLLRGHCRRVDARDAEGATYKVPHVGWNQAVYTTHDQDRLAALFAGIPDGSNFYFTHSYQAVPTDTQCVVASVEHASKFACAVQSNNILATQFHPEKSSHMGLAVLQNFVRFVRKEG